VKNKQFNTFLKDSSTIETKNLFPKTAKNKLKGRSKRTSGVTSQVSRNPSMGESRVTSSMITVKKSNIKSKLFKYKNLK